MLPKGRADDASDDDDVIVVDEYDVYDDEYDDYEEEEDDGLVAGPDERDRDLLDGSWEQQYYAGSHRRRDWSSVGVALTLLLLLGLILPTILIALR